MTLLRMSTISREAQSVVILLQQLTFRIPIAICLSLLKIYDKRTLHVLICTAISPHIKISEEDLMAVYQACEQLENHPQLNVNLVLDNLGVVTKANALLFGYKMTLYETLHTDNFLLWTAIQKLTTQRIPQGGSLSFTWVKGHFTNLGNNLSNILLHIMVQTATNSPTHSDFQQKRKLI